VTAFTAFRSLEESSRAILDTVSTKRGFSQSPAPITIERGAIMAYDEGLEARIDEIVDGWADYEKKRMFGGICYLRAGNMSFGIWKDYLIVRCGPNRHAECLARTHVKPFDITGKAMSGWVMVAPEGLEEDEELERWINVGGGFAESLPSKKFT
jgi:hypothetical protein